ncbi:MAG TPA: GNAT family N-acetyltransferase, partial [Nitrosospira sp.]
MIVESEGSTDGLTGLWLLAHDPETNTLAHVGAYQAEYHAWLVLPGEDAAFLSAAWVELTRYFKFEFLRLKYLPAVALGDLLRNMQGMRDRVIVRKHDRPLLKLNLQDLKESFAKKSNKSRFNRLKKLGKLEFHRVKDLAELERVLDELITYYDFRQSAVNHSAPFREDPNKRGFHIGLFKATPGDAFVSVTYLDQRPIAAFWGLASGEAVHLGMLVHSPFLAEHSPGKLHVMQLSEHLLENGKKVLDLTPGGDPWKERFANAHDEVAEAIIYRSALARRKAVMLDGLLGWGKRHAIRAGISPSKVRFVLAALRRIRPFTIIGKIKNWYGSSREFRIYRCDHALAERYTYDERVCRNSLSGLLSFEPGESWQTRDGFLSSALSRLEKGESAYMVTIDNRLAHCGWMVKNQTESRMSEVQQSMAFPAGSVAFYDFYSHPDFRGRGLYRATLGHMLRDAFASSETRYVYISVLADNLPSRHVIETMGFGYQGSFFW